MRRAPTIFTSDTPAPRVVPDLVEPGNDPGSLMCRPSKRENRSHFSQEPFSNRLASGRSPGAITRRPQVRHGLDPDGCILYTGTLAIRLADVAAYKAQGLSEKDLSTAFATIAIFSAVAAFFGFGVVEIGWRVRFLLEGVLFGAIAVCAAAELFSARRRTLYTFEIRMRDASTATFVTADTAEAHAVQAALFACVHQR